MACPPAMAIDDTDPAPPQTADRLLVFWVLVQASRLTSTMAPTRAVQLRIIDARYSYRTVPQPVSLFDLALTYDASQSTTMVLRRLRWTPLYLCL